MSSSCEPLAEPHALRSARWAVSSVNCCQQQRTQNNRGSVLADIIALEAMMH